MPEFKVTIEELRKRKLFVATPMYGGMCGGQYCKSSTDLAALLTHYGIKHHFWYLFNESLITRARNYIVDEFLRSDCTHLMFIDSDIGFDANDVVTMLALAEPGSDKEILYGPYPKKVISWEKVKKAVDKGLADKNPEVLQNFVGDFVFNPANGQTSFKLDEMVDTLEGGTGFMMIQRSAFEKYAAAYPELLYRPDHVRTKNFDGSREIMAYFDTIIEPETKRYLSEDYMFCQWARKIGLKIWLCPWIRLNHMGTYVFGGSLADLSRAEVAATADVGELNRYKK